MALDAVEAHRGVLGYYPSASAPPGSGGESAAGFDASADADWRRADIVFTVAVVSIFLTALPAAGLIAHWGPRLLEVDGAGGGAGGTFGHGGLEEEEDEEDEGEEGDWGGAHGRSPGQLTPPRAHCAPAATAEPPFAAEDATCIEQHRGSTVLTSTSTSEASGAGGVVAEEDLLGIGPYVPVIPPPRLARTTKPSR